MGCGINCDEIFKIKKQIYDRNNRFATILSQVIQNTLVLTQRWCAGSFLQPPLPKHYSQTLLKNIVFVSLGFQNSPHLNFLLHPWFLFTHHLNQFRLETAFLHINIFQTNSTLAMNPQNAGP